MGLIHLDLQIAFLIDICIVLNRPAPADGLRPARPADIISERPARPQRARPGHCRLFTFTSVFEIRRLVLKIANYSIIYVYASQ